MRELP